MEQRLTLVTLGVQDLARARAFYEALGWRPAKASQGDVVFFQLGGGLALSLFPRESLAADAKVADDAPTGFSGITLAHNVREKADVATVLAAAEAAGGRIVKPAEDVFWGGHSGYFADTEGHLWEVAWNPYWQLGADGGVTIDPPE